MSYRISIVVALIALTVLFPVSGNALPDGTRVETYQGNLDFPIDMAWVKGTRKIFFTEKGGAIRVMKRGRLLTRPCASLSADSAGERGVLGIALDPRFKRNHRLYVYFTNSSPIENRVRRYIVDGNQCTQPRDIVVGIRSQTIHNGGQIEIVRGKLFVAVGEAGDPSTAQDTGTRLGKILRYNKDGTVPDNNPFGASNPVWSYGHRNPFGLAHKPGTGKIYSSENGPSCDDELNYIRRGRNYGWGSSYQCGSAGVGPNPKGPIVRWSNIIVPTDLTWYKGKLRALNGLIMGDYGNGRLHSFVMNDTNSRVTNDRIVYDGTDGIVDVSKGPGGWLYFLTNNAIKRVVRT